VDGISAILVTTIASSAAAAAATATAHTVVGGGDQHREESESSPNKKLKAMTLETCDTIPSAVSPLGNINPESRRPIILPRAT
jgi:hypothetical protein